MFELKCSSPEPASVAWSVELEGEEMEKWKVYEMNSQPHRTFHKPADLIIVTAVPFCRRCVVLCVCSWFDL